MAIYSICPPTIYLPAIAKIASFSATQLLDALSYLRSLYQPEIRGSRRQRARVPKFSGIQERLHHHEADSEDHVISYDTFEHSYAMRWLTALIAQLEVWQELYGDVSLDDVAKPTFADMEMLFQQAASLLAICAGFAAAGTVTRKFIFDSRERVEVYLTDIPLDNDDYGSVGARTWGGACVLAEMIVENPDQFGLDLSSGDVESRRFDILELGAGTGLVSLVTAKLLHALPSFHDCEVSVVATDFHPSVLANLRSNIYTNFPSAEDQIPPTHSIVSHFLDWSSFSTTPRPDSLPRPFDVIFGADVIYEVEHAMWIRDCLKILLRRPSATLPPAAFHLVVPLRPTHTFESSTVESVFLKAGDVSPNDDIDLVILSKETIICDAHCGYMRAGDIGEDVEYTYYKIGWSN